MPLESVDYELLLSAVNLLNSDSKLETLSSRTLNSVFSLIPNEMVAFDGFGIDSNYSGNLWYSPPDTVPDERIQILADHLHQQPFYQNVIVAKAQKTARISQYIPLDKFHRTVLYNEFYRHIGGDSQLATNLPVSPELNVSCSLHRVKMDFTDRDLKVLDLLAPHLVSAFRNAQFIQALTSERDQLGVALKSARYGVITTDLDLNIQVKNETAVRLLQKYFSSSSRLPDEVARYVCHYRHILSGEEFYLPPDPLEVKRGDSRLKVMLALESQSQLIVLLMKETKAPAPEDLLLLGLTRRESEILYYLAKGKTNQEIGLLCDISPRTVQKHLENIFPTLGVETRSAAAVMAIESMLDKE